MLDSSLDSLVTEFIHREKLPASYSQTVEQWYLPVVMELVDKITASSEPVVIGVSGCQGSGKSTLAVLLVNLLSHLGDIRAINLSMDDFYLTYAQRQSLAQEVHPLFATRGVPGTHDVSLAISTIEALGKSGQVAVPRFDKSIDDRAEEITWPRISAPVDAIVLEGWCLGIRQQPEDQLSDPVNTLEAREDEKGIWRRYVNEAISSGYEQLYDLVDYLIMLKAPSFEKVFDWRQTQENKLIEKLQQEGKSADEMKVMSPQQLSRFIQHYERVTRYGLETLPHEADVVFQLTSEQTIAGRE